MANRGKKREDSSFYQKGMTSTLYVLITMLNSPPREHEFLSPQTVLEATAHIHTLPTAASSAMATKKASKKIDYSFSQEGITILDHHPKEHGTFCLRVRQKW